MLTLTKDLVRAFEQDQAISGTRVAIYNLLWLKAVEDLRAIGVKRVTTTQRRPVARKQR